MAGDVGSQRGIVFQVVGGVVSDNVYNGYVGLAGVVQIGHAVCKPGTHMKQGDCRFIGHSAIAVGSAGRHALEQAKYRPDSIGFSDCKYQVHL